LVTLQNAVLTGESVWIGYIDTEGAADRRLIAPVRVEGGFVTAYDHTAEELRTYPLHRITGVAEIPAPTEGAPTPASGQGGG
ncbi:WYL domain-containing protein, partial [Streptomyces sp. SID11385]|uniref:WYL domain-containing protein n=1 Tax=Streptomyces sp. SID11385 TaxID=2706031 RepID=UPI0013C56551|nr:WYL domain-containing protein [Streptomyces sp. SID11385]